MRWYSIIYPFEDADCTGACAEIIPDEEMIAKLTTAIELWLDPQAYEI